MLEIIGIGFGVLAALVLVVAVVIPLTLALATQLAPTFTELQRAVDRVLPPSAWPWTSGRKPLPPPAPEDWWWVGVPKRDPVTVEEAVRRDYAKGEISGEEFDRRIGLLVQCVVEGTEDADGYLDVYRPLDLPNETHYFNANGVLTERARDRMMPAESHGIAQTYNRRGGRSSAYYKALARDCAAEVEDVLRECVYNGQIEPGWQVTAAHAGFDKWFVQADVLFPGADRTKRFGHCLRAGDSPCEVGGRFLKALAEHWAKSSPFPRPEMERVGGLTNPEWWKKPA